VYLEGSRNASLGRQISRLVHLLRFVVHVFRSFSRRKLVERMEVVGSTIRLESQFQRRVVASPKWTDALAMWIQRLFDCRSQLRRSLPSNISFSSTLPSTPLHPLGRSLCCKKTSLSWNGSTFQTWKRIVNPVVDRRPASGASEWRRREWLPRRGSGFETATFVEQNRKGASAPSGQGVKSSAS
jgi:hypothetical protein